MIYRYRISRILKVVIALSSVSYGGAFDPKNKDWQISRLKNILRLIPTILVWSGCDSSLWFAIQTECQHRRLLQPQRHSTPIRNGLLPSLPPAPPLGHSISKTPQDNQQNEIQWARRLEKVVHFSRWIGPDRREHKFLELPSWGPECRKVRATEWIDCRYSCSGKVVIILKRDASLRGVSGLFPGMRLRRASNKFKKF